MEVDSEEDDEEGTNVESHLPSAGSTDLIAGMRIMFLWSNVII
jgi:hypothetical protein